MAQPRVSEYFSTRKRNRFNEDQVLLNKQKKTQTLIEAPSELDDIAAIKSKLTALKQERTTRSKVKQQLESSKSEENKDTPEPVPIKKTRGGNAKNKEAMEVLGAGVVGLDFEVLKIVGGGETPAAEIAPQKENVSQEAAKPEKKKRLNRAELKQKIEQFNSKLIHIQQENIEPETKVAEKAAEITQPEMPAYLKFKDLADEKLDMTSTLTLPKAYSLLLDSFKGSETIVKFITNRDEICTFFKLSQGIQNITKHTFTLKQLAQLKTVYPEAYIFKQEKLFIDFRNDYHLTIAPNMDEIEVNPVNGLKQFTPGVLLKRLQKFKTNLFQTVKKMHHDFLISIGIKDVNVDEIKRWHQKFDLENLKEIEESELPKPPTDDSIKCKTGQELLSIAKTIYSSRIQEAIKTTVEPLETKVTVETKAVTQTVTVSVSSEKLSTDDQKLNMLKDKKESTYNSLLEKIRNKEKQKQFESMVVNSDKEKLLVRYNHYKDCIRFMLFFFQAEKKSTIELDKCIKKMSESSKAELDVTECRLILSNMASDDKALNFFTRQESDSVCKKWLHTIRVRNVAYLQMDKSFQINELNALCDKAIENLKSH